MAYLKINPELFLGNAELNRLQKFFEDQNKNNLINSTKSFGLLKGFGKVERDADVSGQKTVKISEVLAIDKSGNCITSDIQNSLIVPNDGNWHWIKIKYAISNIEKGTFSIAQNGDLTDTTGKAELTIILRDIQEFPTRVKFEGSLLNTLEYDILEVIDDTHAVLQHPAVNLYGVSEFAQEEGLKLKVVGTFTKGLAVPNESKFIFNYDSSLTEIIQESTFNTRPTYNEGYEFYLARVRVSNGTIIIQDKRTDFWKLSETPITRKDNPCIGIESSQFTTFYTPQDKNLVKVFWGMRSSNWSIDTSNNIVIFNTGEGGKFKSVEDFTNGDFDGFRLYTPTGKYHKVISSAKQGSAINLTLDNLDADNFSDNGGITTLNKTLVCVPDADEIELLFTPEPEDEKKAFVQSFVFPINEETGKCDVLVYNDPFVVYNVQYRYKTKDEYSDYKILPTDDEHGYYTENSFDENGNLKLEDERERLTYIQDEVSGFIKLLCSPTSLKNFKQSVDKGDLIGVREINDLSTTTIIPLIVGTEKNYIYVSGNINLNSDVFFTLDSATSIEGNQFTVHFNCEELNLAGKNIYITENYQTADQSVLKKVDFGDVCEMKNRDGGISFVLKYKGTHWVMYQNYDKGQPFEVSMFDGDMNTYFDSTGQGKVKGYFGWSIHSILKDGKTPVAAGVRTETYNNGASVTKTFNIGETGGEMNHQLTIDEMPKHKHPITASNKNSTEGFGAVAGTDLVGIESGGNTDEVGGDKQHNIMQPYYVLAFTKKNY